MKAKRTRPVAPEFTADETKAIQSAALAVWNEVGYDYIAAVAEEKRKDANAVAIPRAHVIEIVADAGRLTSQLKASGRGARHFAAHVATIDFEKLATRVDALDYDALKKILKPAFNYSRYGL